MDCSIGIMVAGVSFRKTTLEIRNKFALTSEHVKRIYADVSTCNRTEIYSTGNRTETLLNLLAENTSATPQEISKYVFIKTGDEAVKHLFRVAAGMDSQILGDYEIIGQLKNAFMLAKSHGRTPGIWKSFSTRLCNRQGR